MSMNFNNSNNPQPKRPHWKRGVFFIILAAIILRLFLYQLPHQLARINQAQKNVDIAKENVRLSKIWVDRADKRELRLLKKYTSTGLYNRKSKCTQGD